MKLIADHDHLISYATAARDVAPDKVDTCRVRVYEPESEGDWYIVIITETGGWITSAMPSIAGTVLTDFTGEIDPHRVMFVEHLSSEARRGDEETSDVVIYNDVDVESGRFARNPPRVRVGNPSWLAHGRAAVEALIGGEVRAIMRASASSRSFAETRNVIRDHAAENILVHVDPPQFESTCSNGLRHYRREMTDD